ncbi:MAG: glycosyltransferase [Chloroflexota bacterium]|nr:glycosyltransferase [Chloroflexota bacterium]
MLSYQLSKKGHEVVWWTSTFDHYNRKHRFTEDQELSVSGKYLIHYLKGYGYKNNVSLSRIIDNNIVAKKFKNKAEKVLLKPDIILSSIPTAELSLEAVKFGKKYNIPVVLDIRDMWPDVFLDVLPDIIRKIYPLFSQFIERKLKKACNQADQIIGITNEFVDWGIKHSGRTKEVLDKEFYLGYIPSKSNKKDINKGFKYWSHHYGLFKNSDDLVVSYFGVLGKVYDFDPIIKAAEILQKKKVRKIKFVICGTGENLEYLREKTKNLKNFFLPGWVYKDEIES